MNEKEIIKNASKIIDEITIFKGDIISFICQHEEFDGIPVRSLLAPEYIESGVTSESAYIYLIGSYLYYSVSSEPVTWLQRRRFAEYIFTEDLNEIFRRTLCSYHKRRFTSLQELRTALERLL